MRKLKPVRLAVEELPEAGGLQQGILSLFLLPTWAGMFCLLILIDPPGMLLPCKCSPPSAARSPFLPVSRVHMGLVISISSLQSWALRESIRKTDRVLEPSRQTDIQDPGPWSYPGGQLLYLGPWAFFRPRQTTSLQGPEPECLPAAPKPPPHKGPKLRVWYPAPLSLHIYLFLMQPIIF